MKKFLILSFLVLFLNVVWAQNASPINSKNGKIEVIAYSSAQLTPSDIYVSFVLKEYIENGVTVSTEKSLNEIKVLIQRVGCNPDDLKIGNVYGYLVNSDDNATEFKHKVQYILRMNSLECVHQLISSINNKCLESFNVDELAAKQTLTVINELQAKAFNSASEKADEFLSLFNKKRGRLLEIHEIDGTFIEPNSNTSGATNKSIKRSGDIQYYETKYNNTKTVKLEYEAKVIFEIK